jgi:hypothetical protein
MGEKNNSGGIKIRCFFFAERIVCITKMAYCEAQPSQNASAASPLPCCARPKKKLGCRMPNPECDIRSQGSKIRFFPAYFS